MRRGLCWILCSWVALWPAGAASAPAERHSTADERESLGLTLYQGRFGLVREVRRVELGSGAAVLVFEDVAATLQPETVELRSRSAAGALRVLEQRYRYDLLSREALLRRYVGEPVRLYRWSESAGREEVRDATLLAVDGEPIFRIGEEISLGWPGRIGFPGGARGLEARPSLVWRLESREAQQPLEVSYLAGGLDWRADYALVLGAGEREADLLAWVTLINESGTDFEGARVQFVAGEVQRVADEPPRPMRATAAFEAAAPAVREEGLLEYHLYTLERPTTLHQHERVQVALLEGRGLDVRERLRLEAPPYLFRGAVPETVPEQRVAVVLELANRAEHGLGRPLPAGTVRVYRADAEGTRQFVGEDRIPHTPPGEPLEVHVGQAFDVVGARRQMDYRALGSCSAESAWRLELRNRKSEAVEVDALERVGGEWEILDSSEPAEKQDATSFRFRVTVPAGEVKTIDYRVRLRWC